MGAGCILEHLRTIAQSRIRKPSPLLSELGEDAKFLAGGQSLIPLMKLRLSTPRHLVDLNFIPETSYIRQQWSAALRGHDAPCRDRCLCR